MNSPAPRWFLWVGALALAGYALFIGFNSAVVAAGPDSSGYLNSARLLAAGQVRTPLRVPPEFGPADKVDSAHFLPPGFRLASDRSELVATYPTGLPLHFAVAGRLLGWEVGPFLVQLGAAVVAVWLCYLAARELGASYELAAAGAAMLAAFSVFVFTSIQTLSDTLSVAWTLAAIYFGLRADRDRKWAAACGAAFAVAVLVRPSNLLLAPGVMLLIGFNVRRLLHFALGGLPGAAWVLWYNHAAYGGALRSGYGNSFEAFAISYGPPTAVHFAKWLVLLLPAILLVLPFAGVSRRNGRRRELVAIGLMVAANVGLYLFYDVSRDVWWCLRFILPGVAALILASILGLDSLARGAGARWPRAFRPVAAAGLVLWSAALSWYWLRNLHVLYVPTYERAYRDAAELVRKQVPANGIVVCGVFSGSVYYYTALPTLIWDALRPEDFQRYASLARSGGRPVFALIFDREEDDVLRRRCPGDWTRLGTSGEIGLWALR